MPIIDDFPYSGRWDSVGFDCSNCIHIKQPEKWPDVKNEYSCSFHKASLSMELNESKYKEGEWFCKDFENNGTANQKAFQHFQKIKGTLSNKVLYGFYNKGILKEINIY